MSVTPDGWGNTTLIVNRPDLLIEDLSTSVMAGRYVWFISGQHQPADIPPNWQPTAKTITLGYASATRYFVSYDPLAY